VQLERAVSKVRFVFANTTGSSNLYITGITLNAGMIPNAEYLIPRTPMEISGGYYSSTKPLFSGSEKPVASVSNPTLYIYDGQEAQEYEDIINTLINTTETEEKWMEVGPFYLRESDKQLSGTISYKIGNEVQPDGVFTMDAAGDFSRNHTWIIYAYHLGGGFLEMNTLYIKDWTTKTKDYEVYNW